MDNKSIPTVLEVSYSHASVVLGDILTDYESHMQHLLEEGYADEQRLNRTTLSCEISAILLNPKDRQIYHGRFPQ